MTRSIGLALVLAAAVAPAGWAQANSSGTVTAADYDRAAKFLSWNSAPLVTGMASRPQWLPDGRFWYSVRGDSGTEYTMVDPAHHRKSPAFDSQRMAATLSAAAGNTVDPSDLRVTDLDAQSVTFVVGRQMWDCNLAATQCSSANRRNAAASRSVSLSPDGKLGAFIRDWNLWVRDMATGQERQLTTNGEPDFGYATDNAGWTHSDRAVVLWSPDSRKIATFQQDQRNVGEMYVVETHAGHPVLQAWKYPLPGDSIVTMIQRVIINVDGPSVVRLKMAPDQHRSTYCDDISCSGNELSDAQWSPDGSKLYFVSSSRDHKIATLRVADAATGDVRDILKETSPTQYESGFDQSNWQVLPSGDVIWFSERDNWGHLYHYDLNGKLINRITQGPWPVLQLLRVDPKSKTLYFVGAGREPGDPYFRHFYSVGLDGKGLRLLTPDSADHSVSLSPDGKWFIDTYSTPVTPPVSVLRDSRGRLVMPLEKADISQLLATGWTPPIPFSVKARDGKTDLYGLMYRPSNFDSTKHYPIINNIYPGPQTGSVGSRSFSTRGDQRALAELGFIVVQLDAMGTPMRSKSFHDAYYGNMGDNGLPDQVAGMKQLAERYPWIDISRAGIYGHSGGGFATADAMFRYPDFFKVGISEAGNHDNRVYEDDWGERYQGLLVRYGHDSTSYDNQANQLVAKNLKGKLLIAYGTTDDNVPPYNSLLVVNALIAANKDFDLLALPNRRHGFGGEPYMIRRRWDYFVRNLMGAEPPHEYELTPPANRFSRR
ncbi:MAG TPA: DPP IV N-terminal domain-containing protein [Gemmatimonadales bacterium]|nr:DPP IV N-terminal domain-containing protein [Gemmatimonadales bacterium]